MGSRLRSAATVGLVTSALLMGSSLAYSADNNGLVNRVILTARSALNRRPALGASADGRRVCVVWDGVLEGNRRIFFKERLDGQWLPEVIIDTEPTADNNSPVVAIDSAGDPYVVWLAKVGERHRVFCAFRTAGQFVNAGCISREDPEENCEAATVKVDEHGRPWIAWQAGSGSAYTIRCATQADDGDFRVWSLCAAGQNYNLYPEVFFSPEPIVVWYAAESSNFVLSGRRFDATQQVWQPYTVEDLDAMPANRLPHLIKSASGSLAGMWYDEVDFADRVFLGVQAKETKGAGGVVDHLPQATNQCVSGGVSGGELALTWCSDSPSSGSQVYLAHGSTLPFSAEQLVSNGEKSGYYGAPRLAGTPSGACIVWEADAEQGGTGSIYCADVQF